MRTTDYFWCFLGLLFLAMSSVICQKISAMRVVMMNPESFKPEWFKNQNGEPVKTQKELKIMFDNYRWPMPIDLWVTAATAAVLAALREM